MRAAVYYSRTPAAKAKAQKEYTEMNWIVKRSRQVEKRSFLEALAAEAEEAAHYTWSFQRSLALERSETHMNSYEGLTCRVIYGQQLTDAFELRTEVRQGCLFPSFMFL